MWKREQEYDSSEAEDKSRDTHDSSSDRSEVEEGTESQTKTNVSSEPVVGRGF